MPLITSLVTLYSKIGRMRVLSPPNVIDSAERIGRKILDTYLKPDKSFLELREMVNSNSIRIIGDFSQACREEFESLRPQQFFSLAVRIGARLKRRSQSLGALRQGLPVEFLYRPGIHTFCQISQDFSE